MKRIIPFILAVCLLVGLLSFPGNTNLSRAANLPVAGARESGVGGMRNALVQETSTPMLPGPLSNSPHFTSKTIRLGDGTILEEDIIDGPSKPPEGYERPLVVLPKTNRAQGTKILTVPAFRWFFGSAATSAAMIAGFYDRNGFPNLYTGPTNGGVIPLDGSAWPVWTDGNGDTFAQSPLTASHQGLDGRTTRGSIDDYWVGYLSEAQDPYITNGWTPHEWGDAIGDYMKISQSAYGFIDGISSVSSLSSPEPLTCDDMEAIGITNSDVTYGRKLFYEARGYTVTECYNRKTNNNVREGFSFANYVEEIDAGRPVMLNLRAHSVVGIGYDVSTVTVYLYDTWDDLVHSMPWGGSYAGLPLRSVSIVNISMGNRPGAFGKNSPANGAVDLLPSLSLSWGGSSGATSYEYCISAIGDNACSYWQSTGTSTSVSPDGLTAGTTYYWRVRAKNADGITYADGSFNAVWSFTTGRIPAAPSDLQQTGATQTSVTLSWSDNSDNESGFRIFRWGNSHWNAIGTVGANLTSYTDPTLNCRIDDSFDYHVYQVSAYNAYGESPLPDSTLRAWTAFCSGSPGAFHKNAPSSGATAVSASPTLSWGSSSGTASYEYCYDTSDDGACSSWQTTEQRSTSISLRGLAGDTTYYWQVRAIGEEGTAYADGADTAFWSFTTGGVPAAPSNLQQTDATETSITFSWSDNSDNESGFRIYQWGDAMTRVDLGSVDPDFTSFTDTTVKCNRSYRYEVYAYTAYGASDSVYLYSAQTNTCSTLPGTFDKSAPSNGTTDISTRPTLSWDGSSGATSYEYCYSTSDDTCSYWQSAETSTSVNLYYFLTRGTTYYWQVRADNEAGTTYADGADTAFWSFTTGSIPAAPSNVQQTGAAQTGLTISWSDNSDNESGFRIYRLGEIGWPGPEIGTVEANVTSYTDSSLECGSGYYYAVTAYNAIGESDVPDDDYVMVVTNNCGPSRDFNKSTPSNDATAVSTSLTLSWGGSSGATSYEYCYDVYDDGTCWWTWHSVGANTSVNLSGLDPETTYYWQVRAVDGTGIPTYADDESWWRFTTSVQEYNIYLPSVANP